VTTTPTPPAARSGRPRRRAVSATLAALAVVLAACGGDDGADVATTTSGAAPATEEASDLEVIDVEEGGEGATDRDADIDLGEAEPGTDPQLAALGHDRIRTAWITLELDDPEAGVDQVAAAAAANGGYVALADLLRDDTTGELGGTVTVRVPSDRLLPALDAFEDLAVAAPERRIEEEDVGVEVTDLRAQVDNATAYESELRELLTEVRQGTSDPDELLPVVERLRSVRAEIDRASAQLERLEQRVALATITVTLRPTRDATPIAAATWAPLRTLEEALAATGRALAVVADAAIWVAVTALPIVIVLAGPPLALWRWSRRRGTSAGRGGDAPAAPPA
jgi:hypothetical protein